MRGAYDDSKGSRRAKSRLSGGNGTTTHNHSMEIDLSESSKNRSAMGNSVIEQIEAISRINHNDPALLASAGGSEFR